MLKILLFLLALPLIAFAKTCIWLEGNIMSSHLKRARAPKSGCGLVRRWQDQAEYEAHKIREQAYSFRKKLDEKERKHQQELARVRREQERRRQEDLARMRREQKRNRL